VLARLAALAPGAWNGKTKISEAGAECSREEANLRTRFRKPPCRRKSASLTRRLWRKKHAPGKNRTGASTSPSHSLLRPRSRVWLGKDRRAGAGRCSRSAVSGRSSASRLSSSGGCGGLLVRARSASEGTYFRGKHRPHGRGVGSSPSATSPCSGCASPPRESSQWRRAPLEGAVGKGNTPWLRGEAGSLASRLAAPALGRRARLGIAPVRRDPSRTPR
jgi:hypothetical protein